MSALRLRRDVVSPSLVTDRSQPEFSSSPAAFRSIMGAYWPRECELTAGSGGGGQDGKDTGTTHSV